MRTYKTHAETLYFGATFCALIHPSRIRLNLARFVYLFNAVDSEALKGGDTSDIWEQHVATAVSYTGKPEAAPHPALSTREKGGCDRKITVHC